MMNHVPEWRAGLAAPAPSEASAPDPAAGRSEWGWDQLATVDGFVRDQVQRRPLPVLGAALALGVAIGWLIKRR